MLSLIQWNEKKIVNRIKCSTLTSILVNNFKKIVVVCDKFSSFFTATITFIPQVFLVATTMQKDCEKKKIIERISSENHNFCNNRCSVAVIAVLTSHRCNCLTIDERRKIKTTQCSSNGKAFKSNRSFFFPFHFLPLSFSVKCGFVSNVILFAYQNRVYERSFLFAKMLGTHFMRIYHNLQNINSNNSSSSSCNVDNDDDDQQQQIEHNPQLAI